MRMLDGWYCNGRLNAGIIGEMDWTMLAWGLIGVAVVCAMVIAVDEVRHPQKMAVMDVVWPVTALYFSVFGVWAYFAVGRKSARGNLSHDGAAAKMGHTESDGMTMGGEEEHRPSLAQVAVGTSHCGAGCMIADVVSELWIAAAGITLFGSMLWAGFVIDFVAAWALGIVFQYAAIRPMRAGIGVGAAVWTAIKADTLSIMAFQVGMYAWMTLVYFKLFPGPHLMAFDPRYWVMMQVAMVCGFATSLPMNWALIRMGWKDVM